MTEPPPIDWKLADLPAPDGPSVFSCFHCGGGSSMGYKLAGCNVLGGVDIDKRMVGLYRRNLHPQVSIISDIRTAEPPSITVDIVDGSPPCTSFSMAGDREKSWGKVKSFGEGATKQRLDDLFFPFIEFAVQLRPRVIVAENVVGLLNGNARAYVRRIHEAFKRHGFELQLFRLSAAHFGVAQARERVFFVAHKLPHPVVIEPTSSRVRTVAEALVGVDARGKPLNKTRLPLWRRTPVGRNFSYAATDGGRFGTYKINPTGPAPTITTKSVFCHWDEPHVLSDRAMARLQSFPDDYDFGDVSPVYTCGMSVPPFMMHGIASAIRAQL